MVGRQFGDVKRVKNSLDSINVLNVILRAHNKSGVDIMGDKRLLAIMKVLPSSTEVDLDKLQEVIIEKLPDKFEVELASFKKDYVAFGLESLNFRVFCPNYEGVTDEIEEILGKIKDVQRAEMVMMSLTKL